MVRLMKQKEKQSAKKKETYKKPKFHRKILQMNVNLIYHFFGLSRFYKKVHLYYFLINNKFYK